ncbi:MAG: ornithine cyclodeaminase [Gemmatimonadetes bacterium]|nr:ornithine cyclodeaminase [Gemmatimonadota bacterium]
MRFLDEAELRRRVDMRSAIRAVADAFAQLWRGDADAPVRTPLVDGHGATLFMPGRLGARTTGLKVVSVRPGNHARGLPAIHAVVLTVDPETGIPEAVLDARWLTALRTGAATGVATEWLARPDASTLAVFGAGAQAEAQVEAVAAVRDLTEVRIVSSSGTSARRLADRLVERGAVPRAVGGSDGGAALRGADIVVTVTDSPTPVLNDTDVEPGTHVNAVGGYTLAMQELPTTLVARSRVFVDERAAVLDEAGDIVTPIEAGVLTVDALVELGAVVAGDRPGRQSPDQVTVFKSVGNIVQDLAVARLALDRGDRGRAD